MILVSVGGVALDDWPRLESFSGIKFAFYKEKHLEKFIKDINDHIDEPYKIYTPPAND